VQGRETAATLDWLLDWPWTGFLGVLGGRPLGGPVARDNTNATAHARLPTVVPVLLGGTPWTVPETRETQKVLPSPWSPCRRGRWGSPRGVRSKQLVRVVECRFRAPVVRSFESRLDSAALVRWLWAWRWWRSSCQNEATSERPKGDSNSTHGTPSLNLPLEAGRRRRSTYKAHYRPVTACHRKYRLI